MLFQILTIMITGIAQSIVEVHPGGFAIPMALKILLIGPKVGWNSRFHTTATATRDAT